MASAPSDLPPGSAHGSLPGSPPESAQSGSPGSTHSAATKAPPSRDGVTLLTIGGKSPLIAASAFVAPGVRLIGDVSIGEGASVWFNAVLRGDGNAIVVGARSNVQDGCVLHADPDKPPLILGSDVTVGHLAMLHGCTVEDGALVGIGAVVLDGAVIGARALVGAKALVPGGMKVPPRALVLGVPGKVVRTLTDAELSRLEIGAAHYVFNAEEYLGATAKGGE